MRKAGILEDPYEGDQPYIFISYSHIDRPEVIKIHVPSDVHQKRF